MDFVYDRLESRQNMTIGEHGREAGYRTGLATLSDREREDRAGNKIHSSRTPRQHASST